MSDEEIPRTGVRVNGRSGGKRDFIGGRPDNFRLLARCPRPSLLQRLKIALGLASVPPQMWAGLDERQLAEIIDNAEGEHRNGHK